MKRVTLHQLLKPAVEFAKARDLTLEDMIWRLRRAWGAPTEKEIKIAEKHEKEWEAKVSAGLVRDRY